MKRTLTGIVAASLAVASMTPERAAFMPRAKRKNRPLWTCKKCGETFRPNYSNSLCDNCIRRRDGK